MKIRLLFVIWLIPFLGYTQTSTETLSEFKVLALKCQFTKSKKPGSDDSYYVYCGYQNARYSAIIDIGGFSFHEQGELDSLVAHVQVCLKYMESKEQNIRYTEDNYSIYVYDFSKKLYISDDDDKYTTLNSKQVVKWIDWLKTIKILGN